MKCHLCDLETKQLNGLMSRHWKKHETPTYTRDDYLCDALTHNGKPPNLCPICNNKTKYSKEAASYDKYCSRACFYKSTKGNTNPNYKAGLVKLTCTECNKELEKHPSQSGRGGIKFCSSSCNIKYYSKPENISQKKIDGRKAMGVKSKDRWKDPEYKRNISTKLTASWTEEKRDQRGLEAKDRWKDPEYKRKMAISMSEHFKDHSSSVEKECFTIVKQLHPDAEHQTIIGYYAWDIYIPSIKTVIEFDGTYWHGPMNPKYKYQNAMDRRKTTYINNNTDLKLIRINEYCWNFAECKVDYIKQLIEHNKVVTLIAGPSGSGKSHICKELPQESVVYWDKCKNSQHFIETISKIEGHVFAEIPLMVSTHVKRLTQMGYSVNLICINESVATISERLFNRGGNITQSIIQRIERFQKLSHKAKFFGTASEILAYLNISSR